MTTSVHATVCPHDCPSVCALEVERTADGRLGKVKGSKRNAYTAGVICAKVSRYAERFHHKDRLAFPMRRNGPRGSGSVRYGSAGMTLWTRWPKALARAEQRHGPEAVWPYWYAGTMGFVQRDGIQRLTHVKRWSRFKSTICVMLSDNGWRAGYGKRWGVSAEEAGAHADLIVVWGANPVATHVNLMSHIARAKKRGVKLVVIDPYGTERPIRPTCICRSGLAPMALWPAPSCTFCSGMALPTDLISRPTPIAPTSSRRIWQAGTRHGQAA